MTLTEIGKRINIHLKRFEADEEINKTRYYHSSRTGKQESSGRPYYNAGAWRTGRFATVIYVSYQGPSSLTKTDAERYLAWLDTGNVGRHYEALRS